MHSALINLLSLAAPVRRTIRVDGVERVFWAQTPSAAPPARGWPVVLSFHGWCMTATQQADDDGLRKLGASTAIVIHPEGYSDPTDCQQYDCSAWQSFNGGGSAGVEAGGSDGPICGPTTSPRRRQCYKSCEAGSRTHRIGGAEEVRWSRPGAARRQSSETRGAREELEGVHGASFSDVVGATRAPRAPPSRATSAQPDRSASRRCFESREIGSRRRRGAAARSSGSPTRQQRKCGRCRAAAAAAAAALAAAVAAAAPRPDILTEWLLYTGCWQPALTRWLCATLQPGDVFVDVGANSAICAAGGGARLPRRAVEACPTTFETLRANLRSTAARRPRACIAARCRRR